MTTLEKKPDITVFFPVYKDELTVASVTNKALSVCSEIANEFEIIIIDDCSPDRSGAIADELAAKNPFIKVIHHPSNLGYGAALKSGFQNAKYEWICLTDGDDEYDLHDLKRMIKLKDFYDLIITFRYKKIYSNKRIFISYIYNKVLRWLFRTRFRDISTGMRLVRKSLIDELIITSDSPFIGAEITIKSMLKGYRIGEMGIQTFPREIGKGSSTSLKNIMKTIKDIRRMYSEIFSENYDLPYERGRRKK
ncbi:MAG: glycosyltransferase family 2 protein [Bacteroidota bacterium]|nr:glycosyltransferase family 2 protein [Bacteroidota bacterium]